MIDGAISATVLLATPLVLAALGGLINRLGGIINIGLEGDMLAGAFVAALVSAATGSWIVALLAAVATGAVLGGGFSLLITRLGAGMIIAGLGFNVLVVGTLGFLQVTWFGGAGSLRPEGLVRLPRIGVGPLADVPLLGPAIDGQDVLTWITWALVPLTVLVLTRTSWGLRLRASGVDDQSANALGLPVLRIRDASTIIAGALAALAGAHLSLAVVGLFNRGMTSGRGFIALAAFFFGRNRPWPTAAACLLFAASNAAQIRLQGLGVPSQLVQTLPYVAVIVALSVTGLRNRRTETRALVVLR